MNIGPGAFVKRALYPLLVMAGDLAAYYLALWLSYLLRVWVVSRWTPMTLNQGYWDFASRLWMPLVILVVFAYEGLYTRREPFWEETRTVVRALFLSFLGIFSIVSLGKLSEEISRAVIVGAGVFALPLIPFVRVRWKPLLHKMGFGIKKTLLMGDNPVGRLAYLGLFRDHYMGIRVVGSLAVPKDFEKTVTVGGAPRAEEPGGLVASGTDLPCLGTVDDLQEIVGREGVRGVVVAFPNFRREALASLIDRVQRVIPSVYVVPNVAQVTLLNSELLYLFYEELFLLGIHNNLKFRVNRWIKAVFDEAIALLLLIPLAPLFVAISVLVAASSPGPLLFRQKRVGRGGRVFNIYKFRTMVEGAEDTLPELLETNPELEAEYARNRKLKNDPRITPIGRFLRKTSLDELPQLINILKGEMSFIGPRPAMEDEMEERYIGCQSDYGLVNPGITGLWQVSGRNTNDFEMRVRLDLWYIRNWSLWLDIVILVRTVGVVLGGRGAM